MSLVATAFGQEVSIDGHEAFRAVMKQSPLTLVIPRASTLPLAATSSLTPFFIAGQVEVDTPLWSSMTLADGAPSDHQNVQQMSFAPGMDRSGRGCELPVLQELGSTFQCGRVDMAMRCVLGFKKRPGEFLRFGG